MKLSNKAYDVASWIGRIFLPALATLYCALAQVWTKLPYAEEIPATIIILDTFWNTCLQISTVNYYKGIAEQTGELQDPEDVEHHIIDPFEEIHNDSGE